MRFALASNWHLLTPAQRQHCDHIIIDSGDWSPAQITAYINRWAAFNPEPPEPFSDNWPNPEP